MTNELTTGFDYESVDKDTAGKLAYYAERGHKLMKASQVRFIAEMGEILSEAQAVLANNRNGTFIAWATSEFDIGKQTVYNYVNAWDRLLSNGWTIYQNLSPTAVYLLTDEETSKPILKKVEHLATQQPVRKADVQRLIDASKPKPKPSSKPTEQRAESTEQETQDVVAQPQETNPVVAHVEPEVSDKPAPVNDWKMARSKAKKTAEALQRALGDLNDVRKFAYTATALEDIRELIVALDSMK